MRRLEWKTRFRAPRRWGWALAVTACLALPARAAAPGSAISFVNPADVAAWQQNGEAMLLVDVRPAQLYDLKHARGALQIPSIVVGDKLPPGGAKVVLYDGGAGDTRAEKAAASLIAKGHARVYVVEGGLTAWQAADLPLVAPPGVSPVPFVEPIGIEAVQAMMAQGRRVTVLDIRPRVQFAAGHLADAKSASTPDAVHAELARVPKTELVVVYDDGSGAAQVQAEELRRQGYKAVRYLYGGTRTLSATPAGSAP